MSNSIDPEIVREELQEILSSKKFSASPQMSAFLSYVVAETLKGDSSRIKAYTIAIDGLGKPDSFDPQRDPSVRVLAKRLRDSLSAYYAENSDSNLTIKINSGSYVPQFIQNESELEPLTPAIVRPSTRVMSLADLSTNSNLHARELRGTDMRANRKTDLADISRPAMVNYKWRKLVAICTAFGLVTLLVARNQNDQPVAPVVYMGTMSNERSLVNHLSNSISSRMMENGNVEVKRVLPSKDRSILTAEDYQLLLSSMEIDALDGTGERTQVDVQLIQAKTGKIIESKSFNLNTSSTYRLSEINAIENYANSLAHANGPLVLDYHGGSQSKPALVQK